MGFRIRLGYFVFFFKEVIVMLGDPFSSLLFCLSELKKVNVVMVVVLSCGWICESK